jgi:hypothetical protein
LQEKEIETYLDQLGQELRRLNIQYPVRVLLIGGAFMLLQIKNRRTTDDVDVLLKDEDPAISQIFKSSVRVVANKNRLRGNRLNDMMADFLRDVGSVPEGILWRRYGSLEIFLPPREYILALKLLAGRQKDREDIIALSQQLKIQTREQAQRLVDQYIPDKQLQQMNNVDGTLDEFF